MHAVAAALFQRAARWWGDGGLIKALEPRLSVRKRVTGVPQHLRNQAAASEGGQVQPHAAPTALGCVEGSSREVASKNPTELVTGDTRRGDTCRCIKRQLAGMPLPGQDQG